MSAVNDAANATEQGGIGRVKTPAIGRAGQREAGSKMRTGSANRPMQSMRNAGRLIRDGQGVEVNKGFEIRNHRAVINVVGKVINLKRVCVCGPDRDGSAGRASDGGEREAGCVYDR